MTQKLLIFEHIPKTAGSSMHQIIWHNHVRNTVAMACTLDQRAVVIKRIASELRTLPKHAALVSHCGFGIHKHLPAGLEYRHFTLLRKPIDRTISHYLYDVRQGKISSNRKLAEVAETEPWRIYNCQTAFLSGLWADWTMHGSSIHRDSVTETHLAIAKKVLQEQISAFGITEQFDRSVVLLCKTFGWPLVRSVYKRQRVNKTRWSVEEFDAKSRSVLRDCNDADEELYRFADALFAERWKSLGNESTLRRYRALLRGYQLTGSYLQPLASWLDRFAEQIRAPS